MPLWSSDSFQRFAQYVKRNRSRIRAAVAPVQKLLAATEYLPTAARQKMSVHLTVPQATLDTIPTAALRQRGNECNGGHDMTYIWTPSDDSPFEMPGALVQQLAEEHADANIAALSESRP